VIHTVETDIVKLVVEIESFDMSSDEFDKETGSPDGLQPKQVDLSYVHALSKLYLHEIRVVLNLEVAFRKNTCFIQNLEGVDLLSGSRDTNLYIISLDDMLKTSLIYLLSKASKTKSWLWHRRLSHLNFGTINKLAKDGLARGIPKLKFQKDNLCSACALGKSKKSSHHPKAEDTNQEKLYLLYMDLCGLIFLRSKDEAPDYIIKCIENIQVHLNATVRNVLTDNGTEFVDQTLRDFYENVSISENLGKLNAKADIGTFVGYALAKKAFRIYNRRTWKILETIHPMFDEYFNSSTIDVSPVSVSDAPRAIDTTESLVSTLIDLDAPSTSIPSTQEQEHSPIISQGFKESPKKHIHDDPLYDSFATSQGSSSNVRPTHTLFEHLGRWTKDHPISNMIGDPSCSVFMRKQLETDAMNMNLVVTVQVALGNSLDPSKKRLKIEKYNARIEFSKPQREETCQVTLDALKLSPSYLAFLINAEELGYSGKCDMLSAFHTDQMHQPWRTFAVIINKCISGKSVGLDRLKESRAQILWATPKKARKFKKVASPLRKLSLVLEEDPTKKPNKLETYKLHASGSGDGVGSQLKLLDEQVDKTTGTDEGTGTKPGVSMYPNIYQRVKIILGEIVVMMKAMMMTVMK
nr:retrovirus-related Pol polyprotein from transposon TNT 1-94 [Tanacetum cinerariifolium]